MIRHNGRRNDKATIQTSVNVLVEIGVWGNSSLFRGLKTRAHILAKITLFEIVDINEIKVEMRGLLPQNCHCEFHKTYFTSKREVPGLRRP